MPWKGKPGRQDIICWAAISLTGIYALALLPFRPILLGANPYLLAALGGSRTSTVTIGALYATGVGWWPLGLVLGTFGAMKFDAIFWWAGKLLGPGNAGDDRRAVRPRGPQRRPGRTAGQAVRRARPSCWATSSHCPARSSTRPSAPPGCGCGPFC